jgi:hypothetical protein
MCKLPAIAFTGVTSIIKVTSVSGDTMFANDDVFVEASSDLTTTITYDGYADASMLARLPAILTNHPSKFASRARRFVTE